MIRSLRIYTDLVETQSFTEAAHRNYLTQSAVSQHLKALEERLGHKLVERGRRRVKMTAAGTLVYEASKEILRRYEEMERALKRPFGEVSGPLKVGTIYSVGLHELPSYIASYLENFPEVDLQLIYLKANEVYDAVATDRVDLGIVAYPKILPQFETLMFKKDELVLIMNRKHRWRKRKKVSLKDLSEEPYEALQVDMPTRRALDALFREEGIRPPVLHEFDNIEVLKKAVEVGPGVSIVPRATVSSEVQAGTLIVVELTEGPFERPLGVLHRKRAELSLPAQEFVQILLKP
ncbi:MAG: LysR family transcriptional regulator [Candidatus Omnitrophica bacterium]|nr:LysR family transcriptional regulator [Candidatus Omnitrophota bacterium]